MQWQHSKYFSTFIHLSLFIFALGMGACSTRTSKLNTGQTGTNGSGSGGSLFGNGNNSGNGSLPSGFNFDFDSFDPNNLFGGTGNTNPTLNVPMDTTDEEAACLQNAAHCVGTTSSQFVEQGMRTLFLDSAKASLKFTAGCLQYTVQQFAPKPGDDEDAIRLKMQAASYVMTQCMKRVYTDMNNVVPLIDSIRQRTQQEENNGFDWALIMAMMQLGQQN